MKADKYPSHIAGWAKWKEEREEKSINRHVISMGKSGWTNENVYVERQKDVKKKKWWENIEFRWKWNEKNVLYEILTREKMLGFITNNE